MVGITKENRTFRAAVYSKGDHATGTTEIQIAWFSADGAYLTHVSSAPLPNGTIRWRQLSVTATAPPGAAYPEIFLRAVARPARARSGVAVSRGSRDRRR